MAAPKSKDIRHMSGVWSLNKTLSDNLDPMFKMQGIPWIIRKIVNFASVELCMKQITSDALSPPSMPLGTTQSQSPLHDGEKNNIVSIQVTQTISPGNFNSQETYILDSRIRSATIPLFGSIAVSAKYIAWSEIADGALRERLGAGREERVAIEEVVTSSGDGWETKGIWAFEEVEEKRHYTRSTVTTKGEERLSLRLVYDFVEDA